MFCGRFDAFVQEGHVVGVDGVGVGGSVGEAEEIEAEAAVFACDGFFALAESFRQVAEVDVEIC